MEEEGGRMGEGMEEEGGNMGEEGKTGTEGD